jgi:periplasmic protein TonB
LTLAHRIVGSGELGDRSRAPYWAAAATLALAAHFGAVWLALHSKPPEPSPGEPPPAVMIDLAPTVSAPIAPPQDDAPGPQNVASEPTRPPALSADAKTESASTDLPASTLQPDRSEASPTRPETPSLAAPPQPDLPPPPKPVVSSQGDDETPNLPVVEEAEAVLSPPADTKALTRVPDPIAPPPIPAARQPEKVAAPDVAPTAKPIKPPIESRAPKARLVERMKALKPQSKPESRTTSAPPTAPAPAAAIAAAPLSSVSSAPTAALVSWKGSLLALLNRNKRYPAGAAGSGAASVAFAIDRAGLVLSVRLAASSGDRALDEEAVALVRRSSPVPAPPPEFGRSVISLTVPIRFNR